MGNQSGRKKPIWFWLGVVSLTISVFAWSIVVLETAIYPGDASFKMFASLRVFATCIPLTLGIYSLVRGRFTDTTILIEREALRVLVNRTILWSIIVALVFTLYIFLSNMSGMANYFIGLVFLTFACVPMLWAREKGFRGIIRGITAIEPVVKALVNHLRAMGLDATDVTFQKTKPNLEFLEAGNIIGWVRLANRNIDVVELAAYNVYAGSVGEIDTYKLVYRCNFLVWLELGSLWRKLKAELKPIRKRFLSREIVDFRWKGEELASVLSGDSELRDMLFRLKDEVSLSLKVKPYRRHQCVRIQQKGHTEYSWQSFPSIEAFEAFERIAMHVRSFVDAHVGGK